MQECLDRKTDEEVAAGKAHWVRMADLPPGCVLTPRIPADECYRLKDGPWCRRVRPIDDVAASKVNGCTSLGEHLAHDSLDTLVGVAQEIQWADPQSHLKLRKDDVTGAFKTLPLREQDLPLAVAVTKRSAQNGYAVQLLCCPFGVLSSVLSWHRVGDAFQRILLVLFLVAQPRYVDDLFGVESAARAPGENGPEEAA